MSELGAVAIGRNEGERLRRCLDSLLGRGVTIVYADSNSVDGSVTLAQSLGAEVVKLDPARQITAARARNEGFERLCQIDPAVRFVQFVDGDCEVMPGWLTGASITQDPKSGWCVEAGGNVSRKKQSTTCWPILSGTAR